MRTLPTINIGLIAPLGVDLEIFQKALANGLKKVGYETKIIRFTKVLEDLGKFDLKHKDAFEKFRKYIKAGNRICRNTKRRDILAMGAIAQVFNLPKSQMPRARVFRQIKRVEEISLLRQAYKDRIVFIGCYLSKKGRIQNLVDQLLEKERDVSQDILRSKALELIGIDENERNVKDGQRFLDCFPYSDFIADCTDKATLTLSIQRFIECFFGHPYVTPEIDEYGASVAHLVALRSSDLSRQVGAAIFSDQRAIISAGCNEVPRAGGGTYWSGCSPDKRDFQKGYDSNNKVKTDMLRDVLAKLQAWLGDDLKNKSPEELVKIAIAENGPLADAMIGDVIEFGRMEHAEMNAITDAARFGRSVSGATLYCTTMPCHMCAKLIVASGIARVVYLQPYHKSLVSELFDDSIAVDEPPEGRVIFEPFRGVTPNAYQAVFQMKGKRKDDNGKALSWQESEGEPIFVQSELDLTPIAEARAAKDFGDHLTKAKLL
ncbi:MAG TPA: deaminase [Allosphingosinicella sp.]|nr:deaminase [Allosphingosinicella sp.]